MSLKHTVECPICGNADYRVEDGLYYCTLCHTQSQNVVELEYEPTVEDITASQRIKEKTSRTKTNEGDDDEENRPLSPHAMYEAYGWIFDRFGSILIELGLPDGVKEALFRLFALYLRRQRVAFHDEDEQSTRTPFRSKFLGLHLKCSKKRGTTVDVKWEQELGVYGGAVDVGEEYMELFADPNPPPTDPPIGSIEEPEALPVFVTVTKSAVSAAIRGGDFDSEPAQPAIEEIFTDDGGEIEYNGGRMENDERIEDGVGRKDKDAVRDQKVDHATKLRSDLILPFCYLACLSVAPQRVMMSDLIRWSKENILPLSHVYEILPANLQHRALREHFRMTLTNGDKHYTSTVYRRALWLTAFIEYDPEVEFDTDMLLARFAMDLNISKHFLPRARAIMKSTAMSDLPMFHFAPKEKDFSTRTITTAPEVAVVAVLMVAMKLTLGLDDHCEYIISQLADQSNESLGANDSTRSFSFCRWRLQLRLRSAVAQGECVGRVLDRAWIDQRDTWLHGILAEFETPIESDPRSGVATRIRMRAYDLPEETAGDYDAPTTSKHDRFTMDRNKFRQLFDKYTSFKSSTDPSPVESRRLLHPLRDTVGQLRTVDDLAALDQQNLDVFRHDFFKDSLDFLDDQPTQERLLQMLADMPNAAAYKDSAKSKLSAIEKLFPCARSSLQAHRLLIDTDEYLDAIVANMIENPNAMEISSNFAWLLKTCAVRLNEAVFPLFRAVQRIESRLKKV